jgi:serine/threonine protein kinase
MWHAADLTSNNVVLDTEQGPRGRPVWVAKICDFNLSRTLPRSAEVCYNSGRMYSPLWASPELLKGEAFGKPAVGGWVV